MVREGGTRGWYASGGARVVDAHAMKHAENAGVPDVWLWTSEVAVSGLWTCPRKSGIAFGSQVPISVR